MGSLENLASLINEIPSDDHLEYLQMERNFEAFERRFGVTGRQLEEFLCLVLVIEKDSYQSCKYSKGIFSLKTQNGNHLSPLTPISYASFTPYLFTHIFRNISSSIGVQLITLRINTMDHI